MSRFDTGGSEAFFFRMIILQLITVSTIVALAVLGNPFFFYMVAPFEPTSDTETLLRKTLRAGLRGTVGTVGGAALFIPKGAMLRLLTSICWSSWLILPAVIG